MRLERIFWPVGHGAFYTERFYNHEDNNIFTVIYDCGSGRRFGKTPNGADDASPKSVQQLIEGFLPVKKAPNGDIVKDIDIAFISHLHVDHINGLPTLLPRIKNLVLPHLSDCKLLDAFLYNAIPADIRNGEISSNEISDDSRADVESEVQSFILNLARGEVQNTTQVIPNDNEQPEDSVELERLQGEIKSGSAIRIPLSLKHNAFWIYKPVDVDVCPADIRKSIIAALQPYVTIGNIVDATGKIDWSKIVEAVRNAGLKKVITIYETVFGIKVSSQHNNYSMPVYSGPEDSFMIPNAIGYVDFHMDALDAHGHIHCWCDVYPHSLCRKQIPLGVRCKLLSCLYLGDFIASDDKKYQQLRKILGEYYNRVGIQQVPHHFSIANHRAELYRGPLFAFGNISNGHDRSFKGEVVDDIVRFGCNPLIITKNIPTMVNFEYRFNVY